jgi:two-component system, CAI-1 autoinducer sensor kinase/phosphatase CqsS
MIQPPDVQNTSTWRQRISRFMQRVRLPRGTNVAQLAYRRAQRSFVEYHAHAAFKTRAAALIGMIGFPVFYFVWSYMLPQPFESIVLRAIGFVLSAFVFFLPRSPPWLRSHSALLSYVTLWYTVPFFFTIMLFLNGGTDVWQLSLVSGFIYLVLLCDTINAFILGLTGSLAAFLVYGLLSGDLIVPSAYINVLPVLAFVLCGVTFLNYSNNLVLVEKMTAIGGLAAHIAHEMRTPLLGIRLDADKIQKIVPDLMDALVWARAHGWPGRIPPAIQAGMPHALERIGQHTASANSVIDMLLMNAAVTKGRAEMGTCSARATIETAIERYHFRTGQRELVDLDTRREFTYSGVEVLMVHVLFNLMKNALRAIEKGRGGRISISLRGGAQRNQIVFKDSGPGMPPEVARNIFLPFFSNEAIGIGTGIGLSFCRSVVESFNGTIACSSQLGVGTEFVISLPRMPIGHEDGSTTTGDGLARKRG